MCMSAYPVNTCGNMRRRRAETLDMLEPHIRGWHISNAITAAAGQRYIHPGERFCPPRRRHGSREHAGLNRRKRYPALGNTQYTARCSTTDRVRRCHRTLDRDYLKAEEVQYLLGDRLISRCMRSAQCGRPFVAMTQT